MRRLLRHVLVVAIVGPIWIACVGDDPIQTNPQPDSGPGLDGSSSNDTGSPTDSGTDTAIPNDAIADVDAAPQCSEKTIAHYKGDTTTDFFGALNLTANNNAGHEAAVVGNGFKPNGGYFRSVAD